MKEYDPQKNEPKDYLKMGMLKLDEDEIRGDEIIQCLHLGSGRKGQRPRQGQEHRRKEREKNSSRTKKGEDESYLGTVKVFCFARAQQSWVMTVLLGSVRVRNWKIKLILKNKIYNLK